MRQFHQNCETDQFATSREQVSRVAQRPSHHAQRQRFVVVYGGKIVSEPFPLGAHCFNAVETRSLLCVGEPFAPEDAQGQNIGNRRVTSDNQGQERTANTAVFTVMHRTRRGLKVASSSAVASPVGIRVPVKRLEWTQPSLAARLSSWCLSAGEWREAIVVPMPRWRVSAPQFRL